MAGTIPLSMTQQMDQYGDPLSGGKLYFFVAGTVSTPQNAFQDIALTLPWPNPITLDAAGRIPQFFLADGLIKIRLTDQHGVTILVADNVQVIGPSSGSGSPGASVDPTTIYQTGDLKPRYSVGVHTGWVRCNGNTIGPSGSPANERANIDTQALFMYLWGTDPNLVVSGGRGASALADWNNGGKTIALPDWRGCTLTGLDDMGAAAAGRLTVAGFGGAATVLGATGGAETHVLTQGELPNATLTTAIAAGQGAHTHTQASLFAQSNGTAAGGNPPGGNTTSGNTGSSTLPAMTGTTPLGGSSTPHTSVQPTKLITLYIKL